MNRHGILNNIGRWVFPVVILFLLLAGCSQKNLPGRYSETEPPIESTPVDERISTEDRINAKPPVEEKMGEVPVERTPTTSEVVPEPGAEPDIPAEDPTPQSQPAAPRQNTSPARPSGYVPEPEPEPEAPKPAIDANDYKVVLDVTEKIQLHHTGSLRVWIGLDKNVPEQQEGKIRGSETVPASEVGRFARITPYAPEFTFSPAEPQRMRIVPGGSSVQFALTPEKEGTYEIGAKIELFDNEECIGVGIPKTTENVSVMVVVNSKEVVKSHLGQLGDTLWDGFVKFWGAFVALIFAALLFVIRRFVKKKTGYSDGKDDLKDA